MNSLQDVVYNWLSIKLVADVRPEDLSAVETTQFFREMLTNDHNVEDIHVDKREDMYLVTVTKPEETRTFRFPIELIECIVDQIENEPEKYSVYPN
ncbi:hypothetical protein [Salinibacillus xinjiangensis]|uniref:Uncharacterized protein n=1 Tax=Salinibacillus xinjiangensis TaxID=1229268 RepID=A0A6G1X3H1_9BACI|nr:hypothetical protein [Salinibacillus xinjiangensis]MRG85543.1 hypothetical protein [Salinibacillus xinjiangensis]